MRTGRLEGKRVAILVTDGFDASQLVEPREAIRREGAGGLVVSLELGTVAGVTEGHPRFVHADVRHTVRGARCADFHGLLIPGGRPSVDRLLGRPDVRAFVVDFATGDKPIGVVAEGAELIDDAGVGARAQVLRAAGAHDLDAFCRDLVDALERMPAAV